MDSKNTDEITLKELILIVQEYGKEVWSKKWLVLVILIPVILFTWYNVKNTPIQFQAKVNFVLEGQNGSGSVGGLLGQIGIGNKPNSVNPLQIIELSKSSLIQEATLFSEYDNKNLISRIIEIYGLNTLWTKSNNKYEGLDFSKKGLYELNALELGKFKEVCRILNLGSSNYNIKPLQSTTFDEEKGVFSLVTTTINQDLSFKLSQITYLEIKNFYEKKIFEQKEQHRTLIQSKVDSLDHLLISKINEKAKFEDENYGVVRRLRSVEKDILNKDIRILSSSYSEALKALEKIEYEIRTSRPFFVLIEKPIKPLDVIKNSLKIELIKNIIVVLILSITIIVMRKLYLEIMK